MAAPKQSGKRRPYDPVRAVALDAIMLIEQKHQTEEAISEARKGKRLTPLDIRFILQLVNGTTKMRRRLDYEIKFYLARPSIPLSPPLSNVLRLGFFQLLFMDRVPDAAAVSESVNLARKYLDDRQARLVNAVMRSRLRQPEKIRFADSREEPAKYLADFYSYPTYFVEYCLKEFRFRDTERLLQNYNLPPTVTYRVNYLKCKPEEVTALLDSHKITYTAGKYLPEFIHMTSAGLPLDDELLKTGKVIVQSESAGLPVRLLNPQPGMSVVDLTAAPGGKTTHAAVRMRNKGRVTALDKSHFRLNMLLQNAERMGIKIVAPVVCDMMEFKGGPFDRVLLDPPCSGWGTAGKHADLRWAKSLQDINNLVKIQTAMIDRASRLVKPGGILVYSTCSIIRKENDQIVEEFLLRSKKFTLESAESLVDNELVNDRGFCKTYPVVGDLDGAFCARLVRSQE